MENLRMEGTRDTPQIDFNCQTGVLEFAGNFCAIDVKKTLWPIVDWIKEYAKNPKEQTVLKMYLNIACTSSSKGILDILKATSNIKNAHVEWYYEEDDTDMLEVGEDYSLLTSLLFKFIGISEEEWKTKMPFCYKV